MSSLFDRVLRMCSMARGKGSTTAAVLGLNASRSFWPAVVKYEPGATPRMSAPPMVRPTLVVCHRVSVDTLPYDGGPSIDREVSVITTSDPRPRLDGPVIFDADVVRELAQHGQGAMEKIGRLQEMVDSYAGEVKELRAARNHHKARADEAQRVVDALTAILHPAAVAAEDACVVTPDLCSDV